MIHVVIPDTQVRPGVPTDHLCWIGQYIVDKFAGREDVRLIHLGDHADMPSLSSWNKRMDTEGLRYADDIAAANAGWAALNAPLQKHNARRRQKWEPDRHILLGNHENRIERVVGEDPRLDGILTDDDLDYGRSGWQVHPFLGVVELDGVWYSHYFYNPMSGRPYSGANAELRLKTIGHSFTMGHQQTLLYGLRFVGAHSQHALVAGACYLHDEDYKGPQGNSHWRGIIVCHQVREGSYDPMFVSLDYLCRRYEGVALAEFTRGMAA